MVPPQVFRVAVFGTWRALPGSEIYANAEAVGRGFAELGGVVVTGGYSGVMEAAARGAKSVMGETAGYTCSRLDAELSVNQYIDRIVHSETLSERTARLVNDSDICIVLPGRLGTLAELTVALEARAKGEKEWPVLLLGPHWMGFFDWMKRSFSDLSVPGEADSPEALCRHGESAEELVSIARSWWG